MNKFVKLVQTGLLPGPTEVARSFQVKTGLFWLKPCQCLSQPVRTVTLPFLIWGSTVLTQGQTVGVCLQRAWLITVETQRLWVSSRRLWVSSRLTTVFDSIPGDSRWLPVVFNILEQPENEPVQNCSSWFAKVVHYCDWVRGGTWLYRFLIFAPLLTWFTTVHSLSGLNEIYVWFLLQTNKI